MWISRDCGVRRWGKGGEARFETRGSEPSVAGRKPRISSNYNRYPRVDGLIESALSIPSFPMCPTSPLFLTDPSSPTIPGENCAREMLPLNRTVVDRKPLAEKRSFYPGSLCSTRRSHGNIAIAYSAPRVSSNGFLSYDHLHTRNDTWNRI